MKRHSLFCGGFWPFLLIFLLSTALLLALTLLAKWRTIEEDVAKNSTTSLQSKSIQWASIETHNEGRTVIIKGTAESKVQADQAIDLVKNSWGVDEVKFDYDKQVVVIPKTPSMLNAIVTQGSIVLRGKVKDQATIDRLVSEASIVFDEENVLNKLQVTKNTAHLDSYPGFFKALQNKGNNAPFSASIDANSLTLNGQVVDFQTKQSIGDNLASLTQLTVDNNIKVVLPPPVEVAAVPEPIKEDICLGLVQEILSTGKINFATGKATINQDSYELLQSLADTAKRCPDAKFIVAGHTDSVGNLASNNKLSKLRAQSVIDHLSNIGISTERFDAVGFGPSQPIADNGTKEGRAQNRRIEFKLSSEQNSIN